jgi:uncharacterized protein (TIGR02611 family)
VARAIAPWRPERRLAATTLVAMGMESDRPRLIQRLQAQRDRHSRRPRPIRALYVVAGFTILAAGLLMLITPGPAFVVIPIGLAVLSLEFAWAEALLDRALVKGEQAKQRAARSTRTERILTSIAALLACGAIAAWGWFGDIPVVPI